MIRKLLIRCCVLVFAASLCMASADKTREDAPTAKHSSGRPLSKMPEIDKPVMFNTPKADAILTALQVFPADNPWNTDISKWPLHPNSKYIIASIGTDKPFRYNPDMSFILVPPGQKKVDVRLVGRSKQDKSLRCRYPWPADLGIPGGFARIVLGRRSN
jgi:hypothetical protein